MTDPCEIAARFDIGRPTAAQVLGGTATLKWRVQTERGVFLLRRRPAEFAAPGFARFDHDAVTCMADAGLPVPRPIGFDGDPLGILVPASMRESVGIEPHAEPEGGA